MSNPKCGRKTKNTGLPCRNTAGYKTDHVGKGPCKAHGGNSTGPKEPEKMKGNKRAVTTGEYETLHYSALSEDERQLYDTIDVMPRPQAEGAILLASIREHRILIRIKRAEEASVEGFGVSSIQTSKGW